MRLVLTTTVLLALLSGSVAAQKQKPRSPEKVEDVTTTVGKVFKSTEGRFTVVFPGDPKLEQSKVDSAIGPLTTNLAILEKGPLVYYVSYTDLPVGPETPEETREALDGSRDFLLAGGHKMISESEIIVAGLTARELLMEKDGLVMRARAFYEKKRLYQLIFSAQTTLSFRNGKASADPANRTDLFETSSVGFFDSFKLTK